MEYIKTAILDSYHITNEQLEIVSRKREIVTPRQIGHFVAWKMTKETLSSIGFFFGKKDHATVLNSVKKIQNRLDTEKDFVIFYNSLMVKVKEEKKLFEMDCDKYKKYQAIKKIQENLRIIEKETNIDSELLTEFEMYLISIK
jgi:hypothetical protein